MTDFMHVGVTVVDLERTIAFYSKWFGFKVVGEVRFPPEFFQDSNTLYRLPPDVDCEMRMIESEDHKCILELFRFSNAEPGKTVLWQQAGFHHLAFKVPDIPTLYDEMAKDGIEFFFPPKRRGPDGDRHWIFFKDPDGNMLELWD
jgi:catechol 2,3-dioxygenase-like lactoylglutathione lyase family enzyme